MPLFVSYLRFYKMPVDHVRATQFLAERIARDESVIFIAYEAEREKPNSALGFVQLYPTFASLDQKRLWILEDLFVVPGRRRDGIGTMLLVRAEEHARETGAVRLRLETARDNVTAQRLYEAAGWQRDQTFHVYTRELSPAS